MPGTYCIYVARTSSPHTNPAIQIPDTFCVDCPEDSTCRGTVGQPVAIKIKDANGNQATLRAVLQGKSCTSCPEGAHQGFQFAPKEGGNGGNNGW